ncbi:hypothetical protein, partial [Klebsiella pneumoniae]|uniref:hypothetical protein n=1 Tax=Klebsiella pneumoniae TaxID=573 RepID=UPI0037177994
CLRRSPHLWESAPVAGRHAQPDETTAGLDQACCRDGFITVISGSGRHRHSAKDRGNDGPWHHQRQEPAS